MEINDNGEQNKEYIEHQKVIEDIRVLLNTKAGKNFIRYLYKSFNVGELPEYGLKDLMLHEVLGFLRAGNSVFKIVSEANAEESGLILASVEKERYNEKVTNHIAR